jgi:hypothetical protein
MISPEPLTKINSERSKEVLMRTNLFIDVKLAQAALESKRLSLINTASQNAAQF